VSARHADELEGMYVHISRRSSVGRWSRLGAGCDMWFYALSGVIVSKI
jgi:hypothetical protein